MSSIPVLLVVTPCIIYILQRNLTGEYLIQSIIERFNLYIKKIIEDYETEFKVGKLTLNQIHVVKQTIEKTTSL